jgi:hypothetical protein
MAPDRDDIGRVPAATHTENLLPEQIGIGAAVEAVLALRLVRFDGLVFKGECHPDSLLDRIQAQAVV